MQALVDAQGGGSRTQVSGSLGLWRRANATETVRAFEQCRLEMFFGAMGFKPARTQPPGTNQLLNWAAHGLLEDQKPHVLFDEEVADKKELRAACKAAYQKKYSESDTVKAGPRTRNTRYKEGQRQTQEVQESSSSSDQGRGRPEEAERAVGSYRRTVDLTRRPSTRPTSCASPLCGGGGWVGGGVCVVRARALCVCVCVGLGGGGRKGGWD
jgi:hypothetical protein